MRPFPPRLRIRSHNEAESTPKRLIPKRRNSKFATPLPNQILSQFPSKFTFFSFIFYILLPRCGPSRRDSNLQRYKVGNLSKFRNLPNQPVTAYGICGTEMSMWENCGDRSDGPRASSVCRISIVVILTMVV